MLPTTVWFQCHWFRWALQSGVLKVNSWIVLHEAMELLTNKRTDWDFIGVYMNIGMLNIPNNTAEFSKIKVTRLEKKNWREMGEGNWIKYYLIYVKFRQCWTTSSDTNALRNYTLVHLSGANTHSFLHFSMIDCWVFSLWRYSLNLGRWVSHHSF